MSNVFMLLALISLLAIFVGLINPRWLRLKNRWLGFFVPFAAAIVFTGIGGALMSPEELAQAQARAVQHEAEVKAQQSIVEKQQSESKTKAAAAEAEDAQAKVDAEAKAAAAEAEAVKAKADAEAKAAAAEAEANKPYEISAKKLFADYEANEVAMDERIGKRPVLVSGSVSSIDKDFLNNIVISLNTSNPFMPARFSMEDSEKDKSMAISKGKSVKIICKQVSRIMGSPSGNDCVFQQ